MTILNFGKTYTFNPFGQIKHFFIEKIRSIFKARSYHAAVSELSRLPDSVLKDIGMTHSNVGSKTYEMIYGKK